MFFSVTVIFLDAFENVSPFSVVSLFGLFEKKKTNHNFLKIGKYDCEIILKKRIPLDLVGSLIFFTLIQMNSLTCDTKDPVLSCTGSG